MLLQYKAVLFFCYTVTAFSNTIFLLLAIETLPTNVQEQLFEELLDKDAQKELEGDVGTLEGAASYDESPVINWSVELCEHLGSRLFALWNRSAGDCLLDSVLQATWGVFDRENSLRRALAESLSEASQW